MNSTLQDCIDGHISPEIAVAHLMFGGLDAGAIRAALDQADPHPRLDAMAALLLGRESNIDALSAQIAATANDHNAFGETPEQGIARIAAFFDRAVAASPEASVALYSLGDPAILAAATAEIVEWLEMSDLLDPRASSAQTATDASHTEGADVLDLGCGIGRIAAALSPRCRSVFGLDVSAGMVAEARRRCADLPNLHFEVTAGQNLAFLDAASFDLVLAIDSFPYLVQAGPAVVGPHLADAYRILRPGGALVILNLSYNDDAFDQASATAWAAEHGFELALTDRQPFRLWDGNAFVFLR